MEQTTTRSAVERLGAIMQTVNEKGSGACRAAFEEAMRDPELRPVIEKMAKDVAADIARTRTPGLGAFTMTQRVAERAYEKLQKGDKIGAAADYAAVIAIGATSWIPLGADATIEILRAGGVDLNMSPALSTINTASGAALMCEAADAEIRLSTSPIPRESDRASLARIRAQMTPDQLEALGKVAQRVALAHEEAKQAGQLPKPQTPVVVAGTRTVHPRDIH